MKDLLESNYFGEPPDHLKEAVAAQNLTSEQKLGILKRVGPDSGVIPYIKYLAASEPNAATELKKYQRPFWQKVLALIGNQASLSARNLRRKVFRS